MDVNDQIELTHAYGNRFRSGHAFRNIVEARAFAATVLGVPVEPSTMLAKEVDEAIESGLVQAARQVVTQSEGDHLLAFDDLLSLYESQPNLLVRTSDSMARQAYSTPLPMAFVAGLIAQVHPSVTVYEPTAGNGSLLLLADPAQAIANELHPPRAAQLRTQGFTVTEHDATQYRPDRPYDVLVSNPPFGLLRENGTGPPQRWQHGPVSTQKIDHAVVLQALQGLAPEGRALLIIGGHMGNASARQSAYRGQADRSFYSFLYQQSGWKVDDHFTLHGSMFRRQGAGFPIDFISIAGQGSTELRLPGAQPPRLYDRYNDLREVVIHAARTYDAKYLELSRPVELRTGAPRRAGSGLDPAPAARHDPGRGRNLVDDSAGTSRFALDGPRGLPRPLALDDGDQDVSILARQAGGGDVTASGDRFSQSPDQLGAAGSPMDIGNREPAGAPAEFGSFTPAGIDVSPGSKRISSVARDDGDRHPGDAHRPMEPDRLAEQPAISTNGGLLMVAQANTDEEILQPQDDAVTLPYRPRSQGYSLGVLAPASAITAYGNVFDRIEATTGLGVDAYVQDRLQEPDLDSLYSHYAAEQIDTLAIAIYNHEYKQQATVVGHDTGIGKTRIVAGLCRYAQNQGLTPAVVTADPALYKDLVYRSGPDTGNQFRPFITNNGLGVDVENSQGEVIGRIETPKNNGVNVRQFAELGTIGDHNLLMSTYAQLQGLASKDRRALFEALAPNLFLIADESHKAGGPAGEFEISGYEEAARAKKMAAGKFIAPVTEFFQDLTQKVGGFVASSATAIKEPVVAARLFYHTTDFKDAAEDQKTFAGHLQAGGAAMQQMAFGLWSESGGCIRFQKDYSGVDFSPAPVAVNLDRAEANIQLMAAINRFDEYKQGLLEELDTRMAETGEALFRHDTHVGYAGVESTTFTSVVHNLGAICAIGLKAEATADLAIAELDAGRKPVIMLQRTGESVLKDLVNLTNGSIETHNALFPDDQRSILKPGDAFDITAGEYFKRYLDAARTIRIVGAHEDEGGGKVILPHYLSDDELGERGVEMYNQVLTAIESSDWTGLPADPIAYMEARIRQAGYNAVEMTGRSQRLEYQPTEDGQFVTTYQTRKSGTAAKVATIAGFQNGTVDAVITNLTTGYSLHAAINGATDLRRRSMLILQAHPDVNQCEQSIGRTHRSGQLDPEVHPANGTDPQGNPQWGQKAGEFGLPMFKLVYGEGLPTEARAMAVLMNKMRGLKSNTAGTGESQFSGADVPDFLNKYGDQAAANAMAAMPEVNQTLDYPCSAPDKDGDVSFGDVRKLTGRVAILSSDQPPTSEAPHPSLALQGEVYDLLISEYNGIKDRLEAMGQWDLDAQKIDIDAIPLRRKMLQGGDGGNPFRQPVYALEVDAKTGGKPYTTLQVAQSVCDALDQPRPESLDGLDLSVDGPMRQLGYQRSQELVAQVQSEGDAFRTEKTEQFTEVVSTAQKRLSDANERLDELKDRRDELTTELEQVAPLFTAALEDLQQSAEASPEREAELETQFEEQRAELRKQLKKTEENSKKHTERVAKAKVKVSGAEKDRDQGVAILSAQQNGVLGKLREFPIGAPVQLASLDNNRAIPGVIVGVARQQNAANPINPGSWRFKIALADEAKELSVKFSEIGRAVALKPQEESFVFRAQPGQVLQQYTEVPTYSVFDEKQSSSREHRMLVVGQVLKSELMGRFALMQDNQGDYHPAYLLSKGIDAGEIDNRPVSIQRPDQLKDFLDATARSATFSDRGGVLECEFSLRGALILTAPASAEGKKFYQNRELLDLAQGEFVSATRRVEGDKPGRTVEQKVMRLVIEDVDAQDKVLAHITNRYGIKATSHLDEAAAATGGERSGWETATSWLPKDTSIEAAAQSRAIHPVLRAELERNPGLIPEPEGESAPSRFAVMNNLSDRLYSGSNLADLKAEFDLYEPPPPALTFETLVRGGVLQTDGQPLHPEAIAFHEYLGDSSGGATPDVLMQRAVEALGGEISPDSAVEALGRTYRRLSDHLESGLDLEMAKSAMDNEDSAFLGQFAADSPELEERIAGAVRQVVAEAFDEAIAVQTQEQQDEAVRQAGRQRLREMSREDAPQVLAPSQQTSPIAQAVARLLQQGGLQQAVMVDGDDDFHVRVPNEPYMDLVVESHPNGVGGSDLYLTHYATGNGDMWVDTEMKMGIQPDGHLQFVETAVQGFNGGELRAPDRAFGMIFAQNLLEQGFGEAIAEAYLTQLGQEAMAEPGLESVAQQPLPPELVNPLEVLFQQRPDLFHGFDRAEFEALASDSPEILYQDGERGFLWLEGHDNPYAYQQDAVRDALAGASISLPDFLAEDTPQVAPSSSGEQLGFVGDDWTTFKFHDPALGGTTGVIEFSPSEVWELREAIDGAPSVDALRDRLMEIINAPREDGENLHPEFARPAADYIIEIAQRDGLGRSSSWANELPTTQATSEPHQALAPDPQVNPDTTLGGAVGATDMRPAQDIYDELGLTVQPLYPQSSQDAPVSSPLLQPDPPTDGDEALLPDLGPRPHHPHLKRFAELKADYPEAVAFVRVDQAYESYAEDAQIAAYGVGRPTQPMQWGLDPDCIGLIVNTADLQEQIIPTLTQEGITVVVAELHPQLGFEANGGVRVYEAELERLHDAAGSATPPAVEVPTGSPGLKALERGGAVLTFEAGERIWELQLSQDELAMVNASMQNAKAVVRESGTEVGAQWMERAANTIATTALGDEHSDPVTLSGAVGQLMAEFYTSLDAAVNPAIQSATPSEQQENPQANADPGEVDPSPTILSAEQPSVDAPSEVSPVALAEPVQSQALLEDLREWYSQARALGRSPSHLGRIEQIGQAIKSGHEGEYGDVDRMTRQHDQKAHLQQIANVLAQSKYLLSQLGQNQPDGSKVFAGKTYTLLSQGDEIAVSATERGEIFKAKGSRALHGNGLTAEDAHKFGVQVSKVRQFVAAQTKNQQNNLASVHDR
ncbi:MAG: strawberry notch C-terminal domain-containing protein [Nodosilinea sp.]